MSSNVSNALSLPLGIGIDEEKVGNEFSSIEV